MIGIMRLRGSKRQAAEPLGRCFGLFDALHPAARPAGDCVGAQPLIESAGFEVLIAAKSFDNLASRLLNLRHEQRVSGAFGRNSDRVISIERHGCSWLPRRRARPPR
jgi:hypothetical protein